MNFGVRELALALQNGAKFMNGCCSLIINGKISPLRSFLAPVEMTYLLFAQQRYETLKQ